MTTNYFKMKGHYLRMLKEVKASTYEIEEAFLCRRLIRNLRNDDLTDEELSLIENMYEWHLQNKTKKGSYQ